jgi:hypothetical protein
MDSNTIARLNLAGTLSLACHIFAVQVAAGHVIFRTCCVEMCGYAGSEVTFERGK